MSWQLSLYALLLILASALAASLSWVAWQRRSTPGSVSFAWMMLAIAEWSLTVAIEISSMELPAKILWSKLQYLGASSLAVFFLFFAFEFTRQDQWLTRRNRLLLWIIPVVTMVMAATNEWHHLVWTGFTPSPAGNNLIIYGHGAWFWLAIAYFYVCNLAGAVALVRAVFRFPQLYRRQPIFMLLAVLTPWVGSILYVSGNSPLPGVDPAPLAFSISGALLAWSLFRFRFLDVLPIARDTIVENMTEGMLVLDIYNRVVDINPAAQRLMGLSSGTALSRDVLTLFSTWNDIRASSLHQLEQGLQKVQKEHLTVVVGKVAPRYFDVQIDPIQDESGTYAGRLMVLRDLTENRQTQEEIQRLKEFNESIVQTISEGIIIEDAQGRFAFLNPALTRLLGYDAENLLGNHWSVIVAPEFREMVEEANQRRTHGVSDRYELDLVHKDGHRLTVLVSATPQYDPSGELTGSLAVFTDLSEFRRAERELANTEAMLEAAFEQSPIPMVLVTTPDNTLRIINSASREYLGIQDEPDYVGRNLVSLERSWQDISAEGQPVAVADSPLVRSLSGDTQKDVEQGVIRKDGSTGWHLIHAGPICNKDGEQIAALSVFPDITERKRAEKAEREQRILAEALRDTAEALNSTLNLDEVLDRILQNIGRVVPHDAAHIALMEKNDDVYIARSQGYIDGELKELKLTVQMRLEDLPGLRHLVETGEPAIISDLQESSEFINIPLPSRVRSSVSAPVLHRGDVIGFLNLDSATPGYFTQAHTDRLRAFADQAAVAIENARLFAETHRRIEQLATLNRIGLATTSGLDMDSVLQALLEQCRQVFAIDTFYLALYESQEGQIQYPLFYDHGVFKQLPAVSFAVQPGLAGYVIETRKILYLADAHAADGAAQNLPERAPVDVSRSYIGTPLLLGDKVLGVLSIQNDKPGVYVEEEVQLLGTIASQAAIAIENARLFQQMEQLAIVDSLTGLYTRRHFFTQAAIEVERAARYNKPLSVIMMDLDHFKTVNDTYGHKTGDTVLQSVAQECSLALRKVDIIGRYGGEEFAIILPETAIDNAHIVAERLRKRIADLEVPTSKEPIKVTACLGLASLENCSANIDMLLDCADQALYAAKQGGRNQVRMFRGGLQSNLVMPFGS